MITAGAGGTGSLGIELAKAWGASQIITSASGSDSIAFVKSLGATEVVDYKKQDLFESLQDDSVDVVYDNYGMEGTADKAMRPLRAGGVYLLLPHSKCYETKVQGPPCLSAHPKKGVSQYNYASSDDFEHNSLAGLNELAELFSAGKLSAHIDKSFDLSQAAQAFNYTAGPGAGGVGAHIGKISLKTTN